MTNKKSGDGTDLIIANAETVLCLAKKLKVAMDKGAISEAAIDEAAAEIRSLAQAIKSDSKKFNPKRHRNRLPAPGDKVKRIAQRGGCFLVRS
ncbi:MAG TPA: hypothetical protein DCS81_05700 [Pantoea septica]|nr:hypothetical protein [Pantoea sp.]HAT23881.1 hypothetical protein [Pantoea septica]